MIHVENIHLAFRRPVLRGVSLSVDEGTICALIGPGASGKSVLFRVIAGLMTPEEGEVRIDGESLKGKDEAALHDIRARIGMLFQNYALFDMNVAENIAFPLRQLSPPPSEEEIADRVAERLARVSLPGTQSRDPQSMSGGQKKRVGIARATITEAPILLYDEPTAGLDPVTSRKIYNLIEEEQQARQSTVMLISSDVTGALSIAHQVVMLHEGRVIFDGTAAEARATEAPAVRQFVHGLTEGPL